MNIPAPITPPPPNGRMRVRYGIVYCVLCDLEARYCKGHASETSTASDGRETDLARRIAEVVAKRAGR